MTQAVHQPEAPTAEEPTQASWVEIVVVVVVAVAFVAGWRSGRGWGRLTGY
jgi:hypothetical protein